MKFLLIFLGFLITGCTSGNGAVEGELKRWHKVTVLIVGPNASELDENNPFLNYRVDVEFTHPESGTKYIVPGYFAADGKAANSSAVSGNVWKAHLSPDYIGKWEYKVSFRAGNNAAVSDKNSGKALAPFDGESGIFEIRESNKFGRDFRAKENGRLKYAGKRYLKYSGSDKYFFKQGPDAPENFLNYADFDGVVKNSRLKTWKAHIGDWNDGDPTWKNGKGKGMIGAINYLASEGMNVFSFLTMNLGGDDNNCFPYVIADNKIQKKYPGAKKPVYVNARRTVMDCSKLDQWEIIFAHATSKGMYLHFKMQETENDHLLDGGNLKTERRLYYRELIARFGHHLALNWNLGEENTNKTKQLQSFTKFFRENDPYRHLVVLHTYPNQKEKVYTPLLGEKSDLTGLSLQTSKSNFANVFPDTKKWIGLAKKSGKELVVAVDEPGDASLSLRPDNDSGNSHEDGRRYALWGTIMAGGAGNEWYFGYKKAHSDLTCQDFRSRDKWWDYCRHAMKFMDRIPFHEMENRNDLIGNKEDRIQEGFCFAKPGKLYAVYLPKGGSKKLDLTSFKGEFIVQWYDPRNGGEFKSGAKITGGAKVSIGTPPENKDADWTAIITSTAKKVSIQK